MQCEVPCCINEVPENAYVIRIGDSEKDNFVDFTVCEECARLMGVIEEKSQQLRMHDEPF
jgi:hypothetical protein